MLPGDAYYYECGDDNNDGSAQTIMRCTGVNESSSDHPLGRHRNQHYANDVLYYDGGSCFVSVCRPCWAQGKLQTHTHAHDDKESA